VPRRATPSRRLPRTRPSRSEPIRGPEHQSDQGGHQNGKPWHENGRQMGRQSPTCESSSDDRRHPDGIDGVAGAEQSCGCDGRRPRRQSAQCQDTDERELSASREHHETEHHRLPDVEPGPYCGECAKRDPLGSSRQPDSEGGTVGARVLSVSRSHGVSSVRAGVQYDEASRSSTVAARL
jgi:hypothetical protein